MRGVKRTFNVLQTWLLNQSDTQSSDWLTSMHFKWADTIFSLSMISAKLKCNVELIEALMFLQPYFLQTSTWMNKSSMSELMKWKDRYFFFFFTKTWSKSFIQLRVFIIFTKTNLMLDLNYVQKFCMCNIYMGCDL